MLELKNIHYSVDAPEGRTEILRDISLTIPDKKLIVLTGPNGGGKTTLAKAIMGLVMPTGGSILWNGEDVTGLSITERARRGISYGFQQPPRFKGIREVDVSLSGGEVKRIEIATILARQPQLMILDEPEAGIDLWSFARLTETFEEIHTRQDCTMVIISHQERIISLADEILVIDKGVIARRGTRDEVFTDIVHSTTGGCPVIYGEAKK